MPTFHVTAPDGHVLEITGPEGSTQEQAIEQAKKQYQPKAAENKVEPPSFLDKTLDFAGRTLGTAASDLTAPFRPSTYTNLAQNIQDPRTTFAELGPKSPERQPSSVIDKLRFAMAGGQPENAPVMRAPQMDISEGLGHVLAAGIGGKTVEKAPAIARGAKAVGTGLKVAAPDLIGGGSMIAGGELLSHLPGMEWPARIALDYPGARQIARGMHAGYGATREAFNKSKPVAPPGPPSMKWMQGPVDVKSDLSDVSIGPIEKPVLPSQRKVGGRKPGSIAAQEMPVAAPETPQVPAVARPGTQGLVEPETPPNAPERQQTVPEKSTSEPEKTTTDDPNQQWSWNDIKEKYGQTRVDTTKAKLTDLADRLKSSNMKLDEFLQLPQEMQDQIVQVPRHPKNPNRPKYSSGFHRGYTNLLREIHGGE